MTHPILRGLRLLRSGSNRKRCDANIEWLDSLFQQIVETKPVRLVKENIPATVPA
ncbi:MAG: hypothetical protein AB1646_15725 [Thermodesulfobacteriota bacterium]